ncbi:dual specificity tyrosine-phosphorylation-regulated kinase 3 like [Schistosoma japonicum]|nr:dual specificity tyrosine-phosphorylation-regulated kinase 3 like [Schistosoma japonicum]
MPIQFDNKALSNYERLDRCNVRNGVYSIGEHPEGISPLEALNLYRDNLSLHERKEILRYDKIFYVGRTVEKHSISNCLQPSMPKFNPHTSQYFNEKLNPNNHHNAHNNNNNNSEDNQLMFNDSDNFYRIIKHDHIAYRYEILSLLGKGSFGQVVSAYDHMKGCKVALKIIRTEPRFTIQAREEIRILEKLRSMRETSCDESNRYDFPIINLFEHFTFRKHICMTFELLNINLYDLLKLNKFTGLPRDRVRRICLQVLKALQFIQKAGIIHCDLKPENILLVWPQSPENENTTNTNISNNTNNSNNNNNQKNAYNQYSYHEKSQQHHYHNNNNNRFDPLNNLLTMCQRGTEQKDYVKLIDFGSSCFQNGQPYPYIQSRFYRAPEILLRLGYDQAIDTWSFGCLVAELINGLPLFPGEDEADQMACIMEVLGLPHPNLLRYSTQLDRYFIEFKCDKLKPTALEFMERKGVRLSKDVVYLPRYCSIRYPDGDNSPQLLPGLSKSGGHVRGIPNSLPLLQAITQSRLRRYRRKDTRSVSNLPTTINTNKMSEEEEAYLDKDNELVVNLISSCLTWLPNERIQSNKAITHSWFNHFYNNKSNNPGFRSQLRVRSMEVSKFVPNNSKLANEYNERNLIHDYRSGHDSLSKINGLRNSGRQKTSRVNFSNNHLVNFDISNNHSTTLHDSLRSYNEIDAAPCMVDAQISPIQEDEWKKTQRNSHITIVQQQQQPSYSVNVSNSPITGQKNLLQPIVCANSTQYTNKLPSSVANRRVTLIYSNSSNSNANDITTITTATSTMTANTNSNNSSSYGVTNKSSIVGNNNEGRSVSLNLSLDHLNNNDENMTTTNNNNSTCDDITISNTTSSSIIHVNPKNTTNNDTTNNSISNSSGGNGNNNSCTVDNIVQHSDLFSSAPRSSFVGSLTEVNNLNENQSDIYIDKRRPIIHTKLDTVYQGKNLHNHHLISNLNRPLSEQQSVVNYGDTKLITENESDSPTFLITGHCSDSTPHLPNLISFNANHTTTNNLAMSKLTNSPGRYSYSNLHQSVPFVSSLTIDKSLNNSMNNIVNIPKMKLATDETVISTSAKRYSVPTHSRLIDIPQREYEISIIDNNNSNNNYNHSNGYSKHDIHFIPVTSSQALIPNDSDILHKLNTTHNCLTGNIRSNGHYEIPYKYPPNHRNQQQQMLDLHHSNNSYQYRQQHPPPPSQHFIQLHQHQEQFSHHGSNWLPNNNNNRKIINLTRNYFEPKENSVNNHFNGNGNTVHSTITLPEIAPKPPVRTKLIISNSNNINTVTNTTSNNNDLINPLRWRSVKSLSSEDYSSTNLYGPQPYSQPNIESHKIIVQRLPQFNGNNLTNDYIDQIPSYYTQYET